MEEFRNLDRDIEGSAKRWKKFVESECPEKEKFPQEWKNKSSLQKLCMMRALRPDRMTYAVRYCSLGLFALVVRFNTQAKENLRGFFFSDMPATVTVQC